MMKKLFAALLAALLALSCTAFAATYVDRDKDLTFEYDESLFGIAMDDEADDELLVILEGKDAGWGETGISIHLAELDDGERFPVVDDFSDMVAETGDIVTQGEWNGFKDVIMFTATFEDGGSESVFIAPVQDDDDDAEVEGILTVKVSVTGIGDESLAMGRDDAISAVLDTLKVLDD